MGIRMDGFVGPYNSPDGDAHNQHMRFGNGGEVLISQTHGKYYEAASRGNMYVATSATPLVIPADTGLSNFPTLWNPAGSGVVLEVARLSLTQTIITPAAPSAFEWFYATKAGNAKGTLGPMTVFTNIPPVNMLLGSGRVGQGRYSQTVTWTIGQRPIYLMGTGITQDTWTAASTYPPWHVEVDYEGLLLVPPDTALCLVATVATFSTFFVSIHFTENPYTGMGSLS
jgi:hypothetical protein